MFEQNNFNWSVMLVKVVHPCRSPLLLDTPRQSSPALLMGLVVP